MRVDQERPLSASQRIAKVSPSSRRRPMKAFLTRSAGVTEGFTDRHLGQFERE